MSPEQSRAHPVRLFCRKALPLAVALCFAGAAAPSFSDDGRSLDRMYPDRTPGYVEEALSVGAEEIETGDISGGTDWARSVSEDDWGATRRSGLNFAPVSEDARDRIERFMDNYYPRPAWRFSVGSGGTIGIAVDF